MKENQDIHSSYIAIAVLNSLLCYTAVVLNSVTIHALRKPPSLPKQLKILLLSLAVSDLGVGLLVHPLYAAITIMKLKHLPENGYTIKTTKIAYLLAINFPGYASVFGVMALGIDRFLAIHLHLRYQKNVTRRRVVAFVISVWTFSGTLSLMRLWMDMNIIYSIFFIVDVSCLVTAALLYYKIYVTARRHIKQMTMPRGQQLERKNKLLRNTAILIKSSTGTLFVYLAFLVCYLPIVCLTALYLILGKNTTTQTMQLYTLTLTYVNSSLNSLLYSWKMRHIRQAIMGILRNIVRCLNWQKLITEDTAQPNTLYTR